MKKLTMMLGAAAIAAGAHADTFESGGLTWTYTANGTSATLSNCSGKSTVAFDAAKIPWTFTADGTAYTVTSFGNTFGKWGGLTGALSIPDAVTAMGSLEGTGITSLSIGSGITSIRDYQLKSLGSLTSLVVPATVTSIGKQFLLNCGSLKALWVKGPATVSSGTQTYFTANAIAGGDQFRTALMGPNTKDPYLSESGSGQVITKSAPSATLFVPGNGNWSNVTAADSVTILKYGAGQELDIAIDEAAMTLTATPTTERALTRVLASAADFKQHFGLDTVISVTNDVAASVEITEETLNNVTLDVPTWYLTFAVKTQAQLDRVLAATTGPVVADITGATEEITPPVGRRVAILAPGGATFNCRQKGLVISFR